MAKEYSPEERKAIKDAASTILSVITGEEPMASAYFTDECPDCECHRPDWNKPCPNPDCIGSERDQEG